MTYDFNPEFVNFMRDVSCMYFLVKDTKWTYIWWHITENDLQTAVLKSNDTSYPLQFILRVYDVTDILFDGCNAHKQFDVEVHSLTDHWYLDIYDCARNYLVEGGFREQSGHFIPITRSNTIFLPSDHCQKGQESWQKVTWEKQRRIKNEE